MSSRQVYADGNRFVSLAFLLFLFVSSDSQIIFDLDRVVSSSKEQRYHNFRTASNLMSRF